MKPPFLVTLVRLVFNHSLLGRLLTFKQTFIFLGITFDRTLSFSKYVSSLKAKFFPQLKALHCISAASLACSKKSLSLLYKAFLFPIITFLSDSRSMLGSLSTDLPLQAFSSSIWQIWHSLSHLCESVSLVFVLHYCFSTLCHKTLFSAAFRSQQINMITYLVWSIAGIML